MLCETQLTLGGQEGAAKENPREEAPRSPRRPTPQPRSLQEPWAHTGSDCPQGQGGRRHLCQGSAGGPELRGAGELLPGLP